MVARHVLRIVASHSQIQESAASWLASRDSGEWTSADEARFTDWLGESTANRVAFLRLEAVWDETRRAKALSTGPSPRPPVTISWRRFAYAAIAASLLLTLVVGAQLYLNQSALRGEHYSTPIGAVESVPLRDGSAITLNTASRIRVALKPNERHIELEQGEAFFVVAKDPTRPFVVAAGERRIVAVGTEFSVRREDNEIRVVVTEGTVRLVGMNDTEMQLKAGSIAHLRGGDLLVRTESVGRAQELLSWREGYLTFRDTTLSEAVAELNRYNSRQIAVLDPKVAGIRISGKFRPTHYEAFVRLLHDGYSIRADESAPTITLTQN